MSVLDSLIEVAALAWDKVRGVAPVFCPIPWRPNALAPVFYGYQDFAPGKEIFAGLQSHIGESFLPVYAPVRMRVLFPTLDGSPQWARILEPCGRYPLIVFAHGQCTGPNGHAVDQDIHYLHWAAGSRLPSQLARAGYVVVVPSLSGEDPNGPGAEQIETLRNVISWMRSEWVYASLLALPPATGLVGHSRGAVIAGRLAAEGDATAYVSLSGAWSDLVDPTEVTKITIPKLFFNGAQESPTPDVDDATWKRLSRPKHRVILSDSMAHFDYLYPGVALCVKASHKCECVPVITADIATMFFGKYLPPPAVAASLPERIEPSLIPPPLPLPGLTPQQEFFAGSYLTGLRCLGLSDSPDQCDTTVSWETSASDGSLTLP
jgi:dienelactone hydrolase